MLKYNKDEDWQITFNHLKCDIVICDKNFENNASIWIMDLSLNLMRENYINLSSFAKMTLRPSYFRKWHSTLTPLLENDIPLSYLLGNDTIPPHLC